MNVTMSLIWNRFHGAWQTVVDSGYRWVGVLKSGSSTEGMDGLSTLLLAWVIFGALIYAVSNYIFSTYLKPKIPIKKSDERGAEIKLRNETSDSKSSPLQENLTPVKENSDDCVKVIQEIGSLHEATLESPLIPPRSKTFKTGTSPTNFKKLSDGLERSKLDTVLLNPPPIATGPDVECTQWVNSVFRWLYSTHGQGAVRDVYDAWFTTVDEFVKKSSLENGVSIEIFQTEQNYLPPLPTFKNMFADCGPNDNVTLTCDCDTYTQLMCRVSRQRSERTVESQYRIILDKFSGRLNVACITEELMAVAKFDGWPEVDLHVYEVEGGGDKLDEQQLKDLIHEVLTSAVRNVVVDLNFSKHYEFPRFVRAQLLNADPVIPVHYDGLLNSSVGSTGSKSTSNDIKQLLVKIIKASSIGGVLGCAEPYCVMEMDDPPQKFQTTVKRNTSSPFWDENFLFELGSNTAEILFEIYDKAKSSHNFLGLGIVGVEELIATPSQRQIIPLQSRPYEDDEITGSLTVEFLFMDNGDIPSHLQSPVPRESPSKLVETSQTLSSSGSVITTRTTTISKDDTPEDEFDALFESSVMSPQRRNSYQAATSTGKDLLNGDMVADTALKEIELLKGGNPSKTTLIIHSVQKDSPNNFTSDNTKIKDDEPNEANKSIPNGEEASDRGRSRKKKRDFFGTIKKRLSRSKTRRSKSVEPGGFDASSVEGDHRMTGSERAPSVPVDTISQQSASLRLSVPGDGFEGVDTQSMRSSISETSAISSASTRTYLNEASTLVLETVENSIKKYYMIPLSVAHRSRWRRKGTKLHIFNDHLFVAKHLSASTICQVCQKSLGRKIGKQGYECRDCSFKCHKPCHVKTDTYCPNTTVPQLELEILKDSKAENYFHS